MIIDRNILVRYFLKQVSKEEKEEIRLWLECSEANRKEFIRERIRFDASLLVDMPMSQKKKRSFRNVPLWLLRSLEVAACLLILLSSLYIYNYNTSESKLLPDSYQRIKVPAGNRANLLLPDGTNVWLNANTTLFYPVAFNGEKREVKLDGEAYFEVKKSKNPFIVKTDKCEIEVLGTTFNVEAYSDEGDFRTTLYEGKIQLYNSEVTESITLSPGQTAELVNNVLQVTPTKDKNAYRWKDGLIYIEDQSFEEIMKMFEKFYDVQILINNPKAKTLGYQGKLRINDGIDHALHVLQNDFPFSYEYDEKHNTIIIN